MTESNFAISSAPTALNIVFTVSTTCLWSGVSDFCCARAVETFGEKPRAKVTANAIGSCNDMEEASFRVNRINTVRGCLAFGITECLLWPKCRPRFLYRRGATQLTIFGFAVAAT